MSVRFSAVQMNSTDDVAENLATALDLLQRASDDNAVLAVLPENFAGVGSDVSYRRHMAEAEGNGPIQDWLADAASRTGMWVVGGTISILSDDPARPWASCLVYDDSGCRVGRYDKIHLFDVAIPDRDENYRESANTRAGREPVVIETPWGSLGCGVCYDLRFPEMFRFLSVEGMDCLALPSAFTEATGHAHWHSMVRARAIENLCYVVAAAQGGEHSGGRRTYGHSMIVDPWGEVLAEKSVVDDGDMNGCIGAAIDTNRLQTLRREFPTLSHRRFHINRPD
jgi:predicted amidohydrolase